jgi:type II secretory pathway pseudopilin PulG
MVGLLILVAIVGLASAVTATVSSMAKRRSAEEQLLYVGAQYRAAIQMYYMSTPVGQPQFPQRLADLLRDPRYPGVRRYLRALYVDPITGRDDWIPIVPPTGGITGIHSASERRPIKIDGFEAPFQSFAHGSSYSDWLFCYPDCALVAK